MNNREYAAALLEGGSASKEERVESAVKIVSKSIEEIFESMMDGWSEEMIREGGTGLRVIAELKFKELCPDIAKDYNLNLIVHPNETRDGWGVKIRCDAKPQLSWVSGSSITSGSIRVDQINTTSPWVVNTEEAGWRMGRLRTGTSAGSIATGHIATGHISAGNITTTSIDSAGGIDTHGITAAQIRPIQWDRGVYELGSANPFSIHGEVTVTSADGGGNNE